MDHLQRTGSGLQTEGSIGFLASRGWTSAAIVAEGVCGKLASLIPPRTLSGHSCLRIFGSLRTQEMKLRIWCPGGQSSSLPATKIP
jgi:hypothetical protein